MSSYFAFVMEVAKDRYWNKREKLMMRDQHKSAKIATKKG